MTRATTPEVIEPNFLQAYEGFDFSEIVAGGAPNGQDCLRLNHATNSNRQNLWQPNDIKFMQTQSPDQPALSFWIRRNQAFAGATTGWQPNSATGSVVPGSSGGMILGVANAAATSMAPAERHGWSVWGTNTDDLYFAMHYRSNGNNTFWWTLKIDDLPLNQWRHVVINRGAQQASVTPPAQRLVESYVNGRLTNSAEPVYNSSSGGSYPVPFIQPGLPTWGIPTSRFSIGDPTFGNTALRGVGNGALCELAQISFHSDRLSQAQCFALYEAMLYGG